MDRGDPLGGHGQLAALCRRDRADEPKVERCPAAVPGDLQHVVLRRIDGPIADALCAGCEIRDVINEDIAGFDDNGLGYWSSGLKQFSANKPLLMPADANGLKFRVQTSDVAVAMIEAMGASAQKLAFKEVYGALQTGVVDGQENSWSNIYTQKFFEVQDGITETNHQLLAYLLVTSTEWLNGLDPEIRDQFMAIVEDVTMKANGQVADKEAKNRQNILDAGGTIRELTAEQRQVWVDTMKPVWDKFEGDIGKDLIEAAVAANASN